MSELEVYISSAVEKFKCKEYESCLKSLNEIEAIIGPNPKITHNRSVVEFYLSDMKSTEKFCTEICQLTGQSYPSTVVNELKPPYTPYYNYALMLYHARYYQQSHTLLDKLLSVLSHTKSLALKSNVVLLSMEVSLCQKMPEKTLEIGNKNRKYIEPKWQNVSLFDRLVARANLMLGKPAQIPKNPDKVEWLVLQAHGHYQSGALDAADAALSRYRSIEHDYNLRTEGENIWPTLNNNLGVIYLCRKKHSLAIKYFQNTLNEHYATLEHGDSERAITSQDRPLFLFNLGLALLRTGLVEGAFQCLVETTRHYPCNPRLWLRLAQCCVTFVCNENNLEQFLSDRKGNSPRERPPDRNPTAEDSFAIPSLSLEFAALCLRNAVSYLPPLDKPINGAQCSFQAPPSGPLSWKNLCVLRNSILLLSSFVSLQLDDPLMALNYCTTLLTQGENVYISRIHRALAHIYSAEALMNQDRASEAIDHLNLAKVPEVLSSSSTLIQDMFRVSTWSNAAVYHILQGDLETARKLLSQFASPRLLPLQIYLEMCGRKIDRCHYLLRKFSYLKYSRLQDQTRDIQVRFQT